MTRDDDTNPKYQQGNLESLILDIAVQGRGMATDALIAEAVWDLGDECEVQTARRAIDGLREHGLLGPEREDGTSEPTTAAIKAAALGI